MLAVALLAGLTLLLNVPTSRVVFEIGALPLFDVVAVVGVVLLWALLLNLIWRFRLLERMFGLESEKEIT
jgi:hypothetical protein